MKLTKENVYIDLRGKSIEELTDLHNFLESVDEKRVIDSLEGFLTASEEWDWDYYVFDINYGWMFSSLPSNTEVTIQQLKEILKPVGTFREVAMRCTQEQFDAIKPKLKGLKIEYITAFDYCNYLINNLGEESKAISNVANNAKRSYNREVHEEWNEKIFLEACGIGVETLQDRLANLEKEKVLFELNSPVAVETMNYHISRNRNIEYLANFGSIKLTQNSLNAIFGKTIA